MRKFFKITLYIVGSILVLLLLVVILLQTPWGKNIVRKQIVTFLESKLNTKVIVEKLDYSLPKMIALEGVVFIDKNNDTLLRAQRLHVDVDMLALIKSKISVNQLELEGVYAHVYRTLPDTTFNYQYIIDVFASVDTSSKDIEEKDTSATAMVYDIGRVSLKDIHLRYNDETGGTYFDLDLENLLLRPKKIDPDNMRFEVKELSINGLTSNFATDTSYLAPPPKDTSSTPFQLVVDKLQLAQISFAFIGRVDSTYFGINAGLLKGKLDNFDLLKELVSVNNLHLENTAARFTQGRAAKKSIKADAPSSDSSASSNWYVTVNDLLLKQVDFAYDDNNVPRLRSGMDYSHLDIRNFSLNGQSILYSTDTISGNLKHLALTEKSGLNLHELRTKFVYHNQGAALKDLYILTPGTLIQDNVEVSYPSVVALEKELHKMKLNLNFIKSKLAINDIMIFMTPENQKMLQPYAGQHLNMAGTINGYLNALQIKGLYLAGLNNTEVALNGVLHGLPDANKLAYDLDIDKIQSSYKDLAPFLPDSLKQQLHIPEILAINGKLSGTMTAYHPDLFIKTSDGDASIKGSLRMPANAPGKEEYDLQLNTQSLNLGKILRMDSILGTISLNAAVKGKSFDINTMNADFTANIQSAEALGYNYNSIALKGNLAEKIAYLNLKSADPNLLLDMEARANLANTYPSLNAQLSMGHVDLQALKLYKDTLVLKGNILADFSSLNPDYPAGTFTWANPIVQLSEQPMYFDSIYVTSQPQADSSQQIFANISNILTASLTGHIPLTQIGNAALAHVNKYYKITDTVSELHNSYDMRLLANMQYHPILRTWAAELKPFDTVRMQAVLSPSDMNLSLFAPSITYGSNKLDSITVNVVEQNNAIDYIAALHRYSQVGGQFDIWNPSISGAIRNDSVSAYVSLKDSTYEEQFALGANIYQKDSISYAHLFPGLKFDYETWAVNPSNIIAFGPAGFYINNFVMSKDNQSIKVNAEQEKTFNSPLVAAIENFSLSNITRMLSRDTLIADGILNMNATADLRDTFPKIDAELSIDNLTAFEQLIGKLTAKVNNEDANAYNAQLQLSQNENDLNLKGKYYLTPVRGNNFDFLLSLNALNLKSIEGLTFGSLRNSSGFLRGELDIKGTVDSPLLKGELRTDQLQTTVGMVNSVFKLPSEKITFTNGRLNFENFKILDANNRAATLSGMVRTRNYVDYFLNLNFSADRWQPINSTAKDYEMFYGKLLFSANVDLKGYATAPKVDGNITIHDSTRLTYAMIDDGPGMQESEGIVEFVDGRDTTTRYNLDSVLNNSRMRRISRAAQVNVNVGIEKNAVFNVVIDPLTGDNLSVSGIASLNTSMAPNGAIGLTGTYELDKGYYQLNYNFLKRRFDIKSGSVITLAGDPLDAEVNITAVYDANIAPYDLMTFKDDNNDVYYKQRLPFQVLLKMSGKVMKPEISFDIVLPEDQATMVSTEVVSNVQSQLNRLRTNPSEMSKQVFAILILGRFIAEDPFSSGTSSSAEFYARQSASRFLSQQLNQIAGQLVKGLDLAVDLESSEDYSTGQKQNKTDLNITASKRLFNDRLTVTVGNDFTLEGQQAANKESSLIPGNLSADYKLSDDGRYLVRAYRKNQMQNVIDGYVVETGVSFKITVDYNRFKNIFRSRKKMMERMRQRRAEEDKAAERNSDAAIKPKENEEERK
jgi:translocation and assembly module TamB